MLTIEEIKQFMDDDKASDKKIFARKGQAYYNGEHDIKEYRVFYYNADGKLVEDKTRSNIRIPHNFFAELCDQVAQYILSGNDGIIVSDIPELQAKLDVYFNKNENFMVELSETITGCVVTGIGYMFGYKDSDYKTAFQCADSIGVVEVRAKDTLSLKSTGKIRGKIQTSILEIEQKAEFNGTCVMGEDLKKATAPAPAAAPANNDKKSSK